MRSVTLLPVALLMSLLTTGAQAAPLGLSNAPPGAVAAAWKKSCARASWVAEAVAALAPSANKACIYATVLEILGEADVEISLDAAGRGPGVRRPVTKGQEDAFLKSVKENAERECKGGGGGGGGLHATVKGLLKFASQEGYWATDNFESTKAKVERAAEAMLKAGLFVPVTKAAEGAAAAAGATIIFDPRVFIDPTKPPEDGT